MVATGKRTSPGFWFGLHVRPSLSRKVLFDNSCATFTPALSSRCPKFSTSSKAAATRSFMWFRQPRTGRKPRLPRSNGLPAPRPSSLQVHRKSAHCAKEYLAAMGRSPSRNESSIPRVARCRRYHKPSSVGHRRASTILRPLSRYVRFTPNSDWIDAAARSVATCHVWTAPSWQGFSSRLQAGRCSHVFGLLARHTGAAGHNALRGSGPGQKPAFEMHWHMWVVLIAGSAGSALRAVRPPNLHITPDVGAISVTPRVRRVPCSAHPWPSWPTPSWRSCWQARSPRPW